MHNIIFHNNHFGILVVVAIWILLHMRIAACDKQWYSRSIPVSLTITQNYIETPAIKTTRLARSAHPIIGLPGIIVCIHGGTSWISALGSGYSMTGLAVTSSAMYRCKYSYSNNNTEY